MGRAVYYLSTENRLQPGDIYRQSGVTPIVLLAGHGINFYTPQWDWFPSLVACERLGVPYWAALRAEDAGKRRTLAAWDDEAAWVTILGNLRALAASSTRCLGICFDGEIYSATETGSGGLMNKTAWPAGVKAALRGRQVREAIGSRRLGQYVLVSDAKSHGGWSEFWSGAYRSGDLLLDEAGFLTGASRAKAFSRQGVANLPGRRIQNGKLVGKVPRGDFWVYPWDGDAVGLLDGVSGKWR